MIKMSSFVNLNMLLTESVQALYQSQNSSSSQFDGVRGIHNTTRMSFTN